MAHLTGLCLEGTGGDWESLWQKAEWLLGFHYWLWGRGYILTTVLSTQEHSSFQLGQSHASLWESPKLKVGSYI